MSNIVEKAKEMRKKYVELAQYAPDSEVIKNKECFDYWATDSYYKVDDVVKYENNIYRCRQSHTSQYGWEPNIVSSLWVVINITQDGTPENPIIAQVGMEYTYGLYYLDESDNNIYLCKRTGEPDGGKIILYYLPHSLVGNYFELYIK